MLPARVRTRLQPWYGLSAVLATAIATRGAYALAVEPSVQVGADRIWYELVGQLLADGHGVIDPDRFIRSGEAVPTAWRAPGYPAVLAGLARAGFGHTSYVVLGIALGAAGCALTWSLGRRLFGPCVGLGAGLLLAVHPMAIATDLSTMSEALAVPLVLAILRLSIVQPADQRPLGPLGQAGAVGLLGGWLAWVRIDALLLVGVVLAIGLAGSRPLRRHVAFLVAVGLVALLVFLPWPLRNERELGSFTPGTMASAGLLAGANCESSWRGELIGYWDVACTDEDPGATEVARARALRGRALDHVQASWTRAPLVGLVRELRFWGLWDPAAQTRLEAIESRHLTWQRIGWVAELPVLALAAIALLRRRDPAGGRGIRLLRSAVLGAALTALLTYGNQRFRAPLEPLLCLAAAVALCSILPRCGREPEPPVGASHR